MKYSQYQIHYSCFIWVFKEVSSNKNIYFKLKTIISTSNSNKNKAAVTEQGTNKAVNKVSTSPNPTLSRTTVSKSISHESVQEPNKISRSSQRKYHSVTHKLLTLLNRHQIHKQKARQIR